MARKLFCELGPAAYAISVKKGIVLRNIKDLLSSETIAKAHTKEDLPNVVTEHSSVMIRRLEGVDLRLQENKVTNLRLAGARVNGLVIRPGETFSFWKTVGSTTKKKGYLEGLFIEGGNLKSGTGGGLCQLANMIHWLVLNSPLQDTELHHHSDALFPDDRRRVPFGTGTSICYNYIDYRFKNTTDQAVELRIWLDGDDLRGELRSERPFPCTYRLVEENHHFRKEEDGWYRISQVYKVETDRAENKDIRKELILDNHSRVMYDPALIPPEQIWE